MTLEPIKPNPSQAAPASGTELSTDEQSELDLGVISTGAPDIDRALTPLEGLGERPVSEHPEVYEQVLGELSATMADHTAEPADPDSTGTRDNTARPFGGG